MTGTRLWGVAALSAALLGVATVPATAGLPEGPVLAYEGVLGTIDVDATNVLATAELDGEVAQRFERAYPYQEFFFSLNDGLVGLTERFYYNYLAGRVAIYDAATGELQQRIPDARFPLLMPGGDGVVFFPDNNGVEKPGERDPRVNSLWYRDLATREDTLLHQFTNPDIWVSSLASSPEGDRIAFTRGNDAYLFVWNVYIVHPDGTGFRRLTNDGRSLSPSFSPDGQTLAIGKQDGATPCSGGLATLPLGGGAPHKFYRSTCEMDLSRPIWIDDHRVVAWWYHVRPGVGSTPRGLVIVDVDTGATDPIAEARVFDFSVSRSLGLIAYRLFTGRMFVYDIASGETTVVPGGKDIPGGHLFLEGGLELG